MNRDRFRTAVAIMVIASMVLLGVSAVVSALGTA